MRIPAWIAAVLISMAMAGGAAAQPAKGDWKGSLTVQPGFDLRVAIHLRPNAAGGYDGTLDSPDQGIFGHILSDIRVGGGKLSFADAAVHATYAATWDAAAGAWKGWWTQGARVLPLTLTAGVYPPAPAVAGLDGEWDGSLDLGTGLHYRLAFHIQSGPHGAVATIDSVDQGAYGGPVSSVSRDGDHVRLEMKTIGAEFDGVLVDRDNTLAGVFTQGGSKLPLTLKRLPAGQPSPWPAPVQPAAPAAPSAAWTVPTDAEIRQLLVQRIDVQHQGVGIVIGVIDPTGRRVIAYGHRDQGDARPLDGDTEFEIGSITKVFTALTLADMDAHREVKQDDPIGQYLPPNVSAPSLDGKPITLVELATHTSGLPRLPPNMSPTDPDNPYADYTMDQLYRFLSTYKLTRDPGAEWEYSNLGFGLLGDLLAARAGVSYEALVKARVLGPLGMTSTTIGLTPDEAARMAVGHNSSLQPVENWDLPTLAGAGALRSTANDLLTFLAANLGYTNTPLKNDLASMLAIRKPTTQRGIEETLGWEAVQSPAGEIVSHGGGTGGFHTYIAFNPKTRVGVVVLTNAETVMGADDIALHILTGAPVANLPPPAPPPPVRQAIAVDAKALEGLVGRYDFAPGASLTVTQVGAHLFAQLTGQQPFEIYPQSPTEFFWKVVDAQVSFEMGPGGRASGVVLHQNGRDIPAARADAKP